MIKLAVVTGAKAHDVIGFYELFRSFDGIDSYIQHIDDFAASPNAVRDAYDAVLFYFMMPGVATDEGLPGYCGRPRSALERLTQTGQGIVVLHHALLAYPQWAAWSDIVGIADRTLAAYSHDERIPLTIVDTEHPITADSPIGPSPTKPTTWPPPTPPMTMKTTMTKTMKTTTTATSC
ncbi:MAG: hypothetical protein R2856_25365 [Caldilineaceae bacterium]